MVKKWQRTGDELAGHASADPRPAVALAIDAAFARRQAHLRDDERHAIRRAQHDHVNEWAHLLRPAVLGTASPSC
jgi:hypothetical protein